MWNSIRSMLGLTWMRLWGAAASIEIESPGDHCHQNEPGKQNNVDNEDDFDFGGYFEGYVPIESAKKQIRVLEILPRGNPIPFDGSPDQLEELLHCRLATVSLEDGDLKFNALSYVWGKKKDVFFIIVEDQLVTIGVNLESALRHLRDHHMDAMGGLPLWVDALCINQMDQDEKEEQIQMMGDIYRRAHLVFSWLGDGDPDTDWLIPRLRKRNGTEYTADFPPYRAVAITLEDIPKRAWWSRFWIIQEIVLAQRDPVLLLGRERVEWWDYLIAVRVFQFYPRRWSHTALVQYQATVDGLFASVFPERPMFRGGSAWAGRSIAMLDMLRQTIRRDGFVPMCRILTASSIHLYHEAKEAHDYIYGIRGLLPIEEQRQITIDYVTMSPLQVFHEAMVVAWTSPFSKLLHLLPLRLIHHRREYDQVPSWVPDLSRQNELMSERRGILSFAGIRSITWRMPKVDISDDKKTLRLRGIYFDAVSEVRHVRIELKIVNSLKVWIPDMNVLKETALWTLAAPGHSETNNLLGEFRNREDATLHTMRTLVNTNSLSTELFPFWRIYWDYLLSLEPMDDDSLIVTLSEFLVPQWERIDQGKRKLFQGNFIEEMFSAIRSRLVGLAVFQTEAGFVGVGPRDMEAGDSVVFPFGMSRPFILRPFDPHRPKDHVYTMLGVAEVPELVDRREKLDEAFEGGLFEEVDIHIQ